MKQILTNTANLVEINKRRQWSNCIRVHSILLPIHWLSRITLSCPAGALLALNDLTILLDSSTVGGCNEMDSERERHKKSLSDEFVGEILRDKFGRMLVK